MKKILRGLIVLLFRLATFRRAVSFEVGPSESYQKTLPANIDALLEGVLSKSHRGVWFQKLFASVRSQLRELMDVPAGYEIFILASGTEAMERAIQNCVDKVVVHFVYDAFSLRWYETSKELRRHAVKYPESPLFGTIPDFSEFQLPENTEAVCFTINATSTGAMVGADEISEFRRRHPNVLIMIDMVSCAPLSNIDLSLVDVAFFSVQKGFGLPAGLAFIFVSPHAMQKAQKISAENSIGSYHSFLTLAKFAAKNETPETPPVLHLYLLEKVLQSFLHIGHERLLAQATRYARELYVFFDQHPKTFSVYVASKKHRSVTTVVVNVHGGSASLINLLAQKGFLVGDGYGDMKGRQIRIGVFPANFRHISALKKAIAEII